MSGMGYQIYHGKVVKFNKYLQIKTTRYLVIDMLSDSGGLVGGIYACFNPIATIFSRLTFDLSVIGLLFMARTTKID